MRSTRSKKANVFRAALAGSMLLLPLTSSAAQRGPHGPGGMRGGPGMLLRELDLSEAQREQVRAVFEEARTTGAMERVMEARKALQDAVQSGTADEGELRQLAYELGQVEGDAAVERARIHARIQEILTADQREELENLKAEREEKRKERRERFEERRGRRGARGAPEAR